MKKLFFIMAMSVCAFTAQAQTTSGIRVGLNMTSATGKYNDLMADQDYNNKSYMGYSIHYFIDVPVIGNFSIQPAVGLSMKGITYEYDKFTTKKSHRLDLDSYKKYDVTESRGTSVTQKHNLGYLDVPILFAYALPLSESDRTCIKILNTLARKVAVSRLHKLTVFIAQACFVHRTGQACTMEQGG